MKTIILELHADGAASYFFDGFSEEMQMITMSVFSVGDMVAQWLVLPAGHRKVSGLIPGLSVQSLDGLAVSAGFYLGSPASLPQRLTNMHLISFEQWKINSFYV